MSTSSTIQIAKTVSGPADPRAPSFLTTLPPEARNLIYDFLFKRDGPVLLHDSRAYRLQFKLRNESAIADGNSELEMDDQCIREFDHGLGRYTPLLSSCRQIYHEAVGVLYNANTFLFSRVLNQHEVLMYNPTLSAVTWLSRLGSQIALLSRVQIDADAICPDTCVHLGFARLLGDILPLLKIIWANPQAQLLISFVHTGRFPDSTVHGNSADERSRYRSVPPDVTTNLLVTLGKQDVLNIKRFSRFQRLLSAVETCRENDDTFTGIVECDPPPDWFNRHIFNILENGTVVRLHTRSIAILTKFCRSILEHLCPRRSKIIFDLDKKTVRGLDIGLLGVSAYIRSTVLTWHDWGHHSFFLTMATDVPISNFNHFRTLRRWSSVKQFCKLLDPVLRAGKRDAYVVLNFKLTSARPFDELRIDIRVFLRVLAHLNGRAILIMKQRNATTNASDNENTISIPWSSLKQAVFLLLSDVLKRWPTQAIGRLPQIWIDGTGKVLRATYPATELLPESSVDYGYAGLAEQDLNNQANEYATNLPDILRACHVNSIFLGDDEQPRQYISERLGNQLIEVWNALRQDHFIDIYEKRAFVGGGAGQDMG